MSVRDDICKLVDDKAALFTQVSDKVWSTPELGFKEFQSSAALIEVLKQEGFAVETGLAGHPHRLLRHIRQRQAGHRHPGRV